MGHDKEFGFFSVCYWISPRKLKQDSDMIAFVLQNDFSGSRVENRLWGQD